MVDSGARRQEAGRETGLIDLCFSHLLAFTLPPAVPTLRCLPTTKERRKKTSVLAETRTSYCRGAASAPRTGDAPRRVRPAEVDGGRRLPASVSRVRVRPRLVPADPTSTATAVVTASAGPA